jgi:hypothetical protein
MASPLDALAIYVETLAQSADRTSHAADRPEYTRHLAAAARMFLCLQQGRMTDAAKLIAEERRSYGVSFLSGEPGAAVAAAFETFAASVDANAT